MSLGRPRLRRLVARAAMAGVRVVPDRTLVGRFIGRATGALLSTGLVPAASQARRVEQVILVAAAASRPLLARGIVSGLAATDDTDRLAGCHTLLLRLGDEDAAAEIERRVTNPTQRDRLRIARVLSLHELDDAIALLESQPERTPDLQRQYLDALHRAGRACDVLTELDRHDVGLRPAEDGRLRFDSLWRLGHDDAARAVIEPLIETGVESVDLLRRFRDSRVAALADVTIDELVSATASGDWRIAVLFEFSRLDDLLDTAARLDGADQLGPTGLYLVACTHYVRRDFTTASALLGRLDGTLRHWDARKLSARIMFERGEFAEALEQRHRNGRLRPTFDEIEYFATLHLGELEAAFSSYLQPDDEARLHAAFGNRAETRVTDHVPTRAVVPQNGPGDEIVAASMLGDLAQLSDDLIVACDPRLASLLRRSFPDVTFVPTTRLASRAAAGFLASDQPARAIGPVHDLLSADALDAMSGADRVVFGRSLQHLSLGAAPYAPYLLPDAAALNRMRERLGPDCVGVVWRSEFVDAWRQIHYVEASDLQPLADTATSFVCLQHDVTTDERAVLDRLFDARMLYLDDLDLRDDFETLAATVAACASVVGAGTTTVELAAAVGTPSIELHPNVFGAWRRRPSGRDYWHDTMRAAVADDPSDPGSCVKAAAAILSSDDAGPDR